jgi:integrase
MKIETRHKFSDAFIAKKAPALRAKSGKAQLMLWDTKTVGLGAKVGATGTTFVAQSRNPSGKQVQKSVGRYGGRLNVAAARVAAVKLIADIEAGVKVKTERQSKGITLREALAEFCDHPGTSKNSERDYTSRITNWLSGWLDIDLADIDEDMIESKYLEMVKSGKIDNANKTIKRFDVVYRFKRRAFGLPLQSPAAFLKDSRKIVKAPKRKFPANDMERDFAKIMKVVDKYPNAILRAFGWLLALTGARPLQLKALRWDDVNLDENTFTVREGNKDHDGNKAELTLPISKAARPFFVEMLALRMRSQGERRDFVFPSALNSKKGTPNLSEYKTLTAAIKKATGWKTSFVMYDFRDWFITSAVGKISGTEARHLTTHAAKDAHGSYETPTASKLRAPADKMASHIMKLSRAA